MRKEVLTGISEEEGGAGCVGEPGKPESCAVRKELGCYAAQDDAEAEARLPSRKQGAVCCTSLRGGCHVDEHRLKGREHVSVAKADDEGRSVESPHVMECSKDEVADERGENAVGRILSYAPFAKSASTYQPARHQSDAKQREEQTCAGGDAEFLLSIDSDIGAYHAIREAVANHAKCFGPALQQQEAVEAK